MSFQRFRFYDVGITSPIVRTPAQWATRLMDLGEWRVLLHTKDEKFNLELHFISDSDVGWKIDGLAYPRMGNKFQYKIDSVKAKELAVEIIEKSIPVPPKSPTDLERKKYIENFIETGLRNGTLEAIVVETVRAEMYDYQRITPSNIDTELTKSILVQTCRKKGFRRMDKETKNDLRWFLGEPGVLTDEELRDLIQLKGQIPKGTTHAELVVEALRLPIGSYVNPMSCQCAMWDFGFKNLYFCKTMTVPFSTTKVEPGRSRDEMELVYLAGMIDGDMPPDPSPKNLKKACKLLTQFMPSAKWLKKQNTYWQMLSPIDHELMRDYTRFGDVVINGFLRGNQDGAVKALRDGENQVQNLGRELVFKRFILTALREKDLSPKGKSELKRSYKGNFKDMRQDMIQDYILNLKFISDDGLKYIFGLIARQMNKIIRDAPKLDKDVRVFRGLKSMQHLKPGLNKIPDFWSTSADFKVANTFVSDSGHDATFLHVLLKKGSSCLAMLATYYEGESEILLPPGSELFIQSCESFQYAPRLMRSGDCSTGEGATRICYALARS